MKKRRLAVLFGGVSSEHEVSLLSAKSVLENLPQDEYEAVPVGITKEGAWLRYGGPFEALPDGSWQKHESCRPAVISPDRVTHGLLETAPDGTVTATWIDAVFPVLHGANGEDGTIQGLLTVAGIPFVGCGTAASAVCMDKALTNALLDNAGIAQAAWRAFTACEYKKRGGPILAETAKALGFPIFVKPANAGSSVGITKAKDLPELQKAVEEALRWDGKVVCEEAVVGRELETAVLGNEEPIVSCVGEILPSNEFYDYEAKYISGSSGLVIPAKLPEGKADEIRAVAARAYTLLGCRGLARVDFFLREKDGAVLLNEPNTLPGFTSISMYPKLFAAVGVPYGELLSRLVRLALEGSEAHG